VFLAYITLVDYMNMIQVTRILSAAFAGLTMLSGT
jgi:hypothetical protein